MKDRQFFIDSASPWMLRLVLDRNKKEDKDISNAAIADKIQDLWKGDVRCLFTNDNANELVLQVRLMNTGEDLTEEGEVEDDGDGDDTFIRQVEDNLLEKVVLTGIKGWCYILLFFFLGLL